MHPIPSHSTRQQAILCGAAAHRLDGRQGRGLGRGRKEGRFSFVTSDPRAVDLACFAGTKEKGRIPVGPRKSAHREGVTFKVLNRRAVHKQRPFDIRTREGVATQQARLQPWRR